MTLEEKKMTLSEFLTKYAGKLVDYDKKYGGQCVDVFRQYCKDVLNIPHTGAVEGAKDLWEKYDDLPLEKTYFAKLDSDCEFDAGDVLVWGAKPTNKYGHVAILVATIGSGFLVFEQDGLKQDGAKFEYLTRNAFLGGLCPRKDIIV